MHKKFNSFQINKIFTDRKKIINKFYFLNDNILLILIYETYQR